MHTFIRGRLQSDSSRSALRAHVQYSCAPHGSCAPSSPWTSELPWSDGWRRPLQATGATSCRRDHGGRHLLSAIVRTLAPFRVLQPPPSACIDARKAMSAQGADFDEHRCNRHSALFRRLIIIITFLMFTIIIVVLLGLLLLPLHLPLLLLVCRCPRPLNGGRRRMGAMPGWKVPNERRRVALGPTGRRSSANEDASTHTAGWTPFSRFSMAHRMGEHSGRQRATPCPMSMRRRCARGGSSRRRRRAMPGA